MRIAERCGKAEIISALLRRHHAAALRNQRPPTAIRPVMTVGILRRWTPFVI